MLGFSSITNYDKTLHHRHKNEPEDSSVTPAESAPAARAASAPPFFLSHGLAMWILPPLVLRMLRDFDLVAWPSIVSWMAPTASSVSGSPKIRKEMGLEPTFHNYSSIQPT